MKLSLTILFCFLLLSCKNNREEFNGPGIPTEDDTELEYIDHHVHLMSPQLIEDWKKLGIPFSNPDSYYNNIDTLVKNTQAVRINLIGMGYTYGNPEYYKGNDAYERMKQENDYLLEASKKYYDSVKPFFAVDPLKSYAIDEIKRCFALNDNAGLKLHFNTSQVYLTEPEHLQKVLKVFQFSSEKNIPIMLHFDNSHPEFGRPDMEILADSILSKLNRIDLTFAHFGTSGGFNQKTKDIVDTFVEYREEGKIPRRHTISFDISAVALDKDSEGLKKLTAEEFQELKAYCDKLGYDNIVFGTDYPLYTPEAYIRVLKTNLNLTRSELKKILLP